jgi:hypothetical protein
MQKTIDDLLKAGMIVSSTSSICSPGFPVPKKDADGNVTDLRAVFDYRKVNLNTIPDRYPIPHIESLLDRLGKAKIFSKIDLKSGYWQLLVRIEDRPKTAFSCGSGLYEWVVLPFGLMNAPATFQRTIDRLLKALLGKCVAAFFDDILIFSNTPEEHIQHIEAVLKILSDAGLKINHKKCVFGTRKILFLGYVISEGELSLDPAKVKAVSEFPTPKNITNVQQFVA